MKNSTDKNYVQIGKYLREKRLAKELSQVAVADRLGCKPQFIANWERGSSTPSWQHMKILIKMFGIPEREIIDFLMDQQKQMILTNLGIKKGRSS